MAEESLSNIPNTDLVDERRRFIRLNLNVEINYSLIAPPPPAKQKGTTKNIGAGGICLLSEKELKIGDTVKIEIHLPDDPPDISATGKVAWVKIFAIANDKNRRYDAGVEFTQIDQGDRRRIEKYIFSLRINTSSSIQNHRN